MVPDVVVPVSSIPLNANGKVDRSQLPAVEDAVAAGRDRRPPVTDTERALATIWRDVLGVEEVGLDDSFTDHGGHSILMIRTVAAAKAAGLPLSLFMFFEQKDLAGLAAAVDAAAGREAPTPEPAATAPSAPSMPSTRPIAAWRRLLDTHGVPGLCVGVLEGGELVSVDGLGALSCSDDAPVTPSTAFHAGSISKFVTAFGVLRLVDDGLLDLDADIRDHLTGWTVPPAADGSTPVITLAQLLGHTSGLTTFSGKGFPRGGDVPTADRLLRGLPPDGPVRPDGTPGARFAKSNGGYLVVQQMVEDVTGRDFADVMRTTLFEPLGMTSSSYDQSFPERCGLPVALGHDEDGDVLDGGWRVRPDQAGAGLWSTVGDLAKVAVELRRSVLGRPLALLSRAGAERMLAPDTRSAYGLGVIAEPDGGGVVFGHAGSPSGYYGFVTCHSGSGDGLVALSNSARGKPVVAAVAADLTAGVRPTS